MTQTTVEIQKEFNHKTGKVRLYQELIVGCSSYWFLLKYELITSLFGNMPGAAGIYFRNKFFPKLLALCGRNVNFGKGVVLRHPKKIMIGDDVVIDDNCVLDAKGQDNQGIQIGEGVFIGRNTILNCKNGDIFLEDNVNIGFNCMIFSANKVHVGHSQLIAAYCYLVGGTHKIDRPEMPVLQQERESKGIKIGSGGWIGAHVTVFDGVTIGEHTIVGAGSVVNADLPDFVTAGGIPVKVIKKRNTGNPVLKKKTVAIAIINYNGAPVLSETLDHIAEQDYPAITEVMVIDNQSTDASLKVIKKHPSQVQCITMTENRGPNPARNVALKKTDADLVLIMDNDIMLENNYVSSLVHIFEQKPAAGVASGQIRFYDDRDRVQYNGVYVHYIGGAIANRVESELPVRVSALSAGAMMVNREKALETGGFDEDFIFGWEDGDFSFRMSLAGYSCYHLSSTKVFHKTELKGIRFVEYQVRNRWWFVLKNYNASTLIFVFPALLINHFAMFCFFMLKHQIVPFMRGTNAVFKTWPDVKAKRKQVMILKTQTDKQLLSANSINVLGDSESNIAFQFVMGFLNIIFRIHWFLIRWLLH